MLLAGLVSVLTLIALAAVIGWRDYRTERNLWLDRAVRDARSQAAATQVLLTSRLRLLEAAAASAAIRTSSEPRVRDYLTRLQRDPELGFNAGMGWIGKDGRLRRVAPSSLASGPVDFSDRDYVRSVLASGRPFVSRVLANRLGPGTIVVLAVPTRDTRDRLTGVLIGAVRLDRAGAFQRELTRYADARTLVLDRTGTMVARDGPVQRVERPANGSLVQRARAEGEGSLADVDGIDGTRSRLVGFASVPIAGWIVVTERPMATTIARAERRFAFELLGLVVVAAIGLTVAVWLSQRLHRARRHDERQAQRWRAATLALSSAATIDDIRWVVFDHVRGSLGGDGGVFALPDRDEAVVYMSYTRTGSPTTTRTPLEAEGPATEVLRTGDSVVAHSASELPQRFADAGRSLLAQGVRSLVVVPVFGSTGRKLGALGVVFRDERTLPPAELSFLESLASQAGQALERARLYEWERRSRLRAEVLQDLTSRIAAARSERSAALALLEGVSAILDADAGVVMRLSDAGQHLSPVAAIGLDERSAVMALSAEGEHPSAEAIRRGAVVAISSRDELVARYPQARRSLGSWPFEASADVAMIAGDRTIGTLILAWQDQRELDADERVFLRTLGLQCAQALERARLYEIERLARRAAERSRRQAALLAELSAALEGTRTSKARVRRLAGIMVPAVADLALVELVAGYGDQPLAAVADRDAEATVVLRELRELAVLGENARAALDHVLTTGEPMALDGIDPKQIERGLTNSADIDLLQRLKPRSCLIVPLLARAEVVGALILAVGRSGRLFGADDTEFAREIGTRAGLAIENAQLYEREHRIALELQQSLLANTIVDDDRVDVCAAYAAGQEELEVGGDWHDMIELPDGTIGLVVGDIVGRGIPAASAMGQLRSALAALAPVSGTPAEVLGQLSVAAERIEGAHLATIAYAVLDPASGVLRYACAGHPPPLVLPAEGEARLLWEGRSTPLGALDPRHERAEGRTRLEPGDTIILYSDGLVERRGEPLDAGLERLCRKAHEFRALDVDELCDRLVESMRVEVAASDDVAVLAVRLVRASVADLRLTVSAAPEELSSIRASLRSWLEQAGVSSSETAEVVLAAGEACANSIEHAYPDGTYGSVAVEARFVNDHEIVVAVRDSGRWRSGASSANRGRGLGIIHALASKVDVVREAQGTTVMMWRHVNREIPA